MELHQLRCFVAVAEELHFGRAARRLEMLPSALGRHIQLLEDDAWHTAVRAHDPRRVPHRRTARRCCGTVARCSPKPKPSKEASASAFAAARASAFSIGAIDTAAAGLLPMLLRDFRIGQPDVAVQLLEDKTIRLLPQASLGCARSCVRASTGTARQADRVSAAVARDAPSSRCRSGTRWPAGNRSLLQTLADQPLIVPDRRSRPHSHDLTVKLFEQAGLTPRIAQIGRREADHRQSGRNPARHRDRAALDLAHGGTGRPLRAAETRGTARSSAGCRWPRHGCAAHAILSGTRCLPSWTPSSAAIPKAPELTAPFLICS